MSENEQKGKTKPFIPHFRPPEEKDFNDKSAKSFFKNVNRHNQERQELSKSLKSASPLIDLTFPEAGAVAVGAAVFVFGLFSLYCYISSAGMECAGCRMERIKEIENACKKQRIITPIHLLYLARNGISETDRLCKKINEVLIAERDLQLQEMKESFARMKEGQEDKSFRAKVHNFIFHDASNKIYVNSASLKNKDVQNTQTVTKSMSGRRFVIDNRQNTRA